MDENDLKGYCYGTILVTCVIVSVYLLSHW